MALYASLPNLSRSVRHKRDMNIPTEHDWTHHLNDLDAAWAKKNFLGKTREQAVEMFAENALIYQEDIMFMPEPCFRFYVHAYIDYLMSDQSKGDSDGASCFFGIVEVRKDDILRTPSELRTRFEVLLRRLAERQAWYDAEPDIYGQLKERSEACLRTIGESNKALQHTSLRAAAEGQRAVNLK